MPALLPPSTIGRCSASSRSYLLGPDGPAGAPPGQGLRSGALIGHTGEPGAKTRSVLQKSPRFEGNPAAHARSVEVVTTMTEAGFLTDATVWRFLAPDGWWCEPCSPGFAPCVHVA